MLILSNRILGSFALFLNNIITNDKSFRYLKEIKNVPYLSEEEIISIQFERFKKLIDHCYINVKFYRDLMQGNNLHPYDFKSVSDVKNIPILTKDIIRKHKDNLIAKNYKNNLIKSFTSGSTGEPLNYYRNKEYIEMGKAGLWRYLLLNGWKHGDKIAYFWGGTEKYYSKNATYLFVRSLFNRLFQFDPFRSSEGELHEWVHLFKKLKPKVIFGYASTIYQFAFFLQQNNLKVPPLIGVFSTAEKLYPHYRKIIAESFNCKVFDMYGSSEILNIAFECKQGNMHINSDYVIIEEGESDFYLDGDKDSREFVLTSLHNYAMPFLRYINGDCGRLSKKRCTCGINFPLLDLNIARSCDIFTIPCGKQVHSQYLTKLLIGLEGIKNFQFIQKKVDIIELLVVKSSDFGKDTLNGLKRAEHQLKKFSNNALKLNIKYVTEIPKTRLGKHRHCISELNNK